MRRIQKRRKAPPPALRPAGSSEELWACWPGSALLRSGVGPFIAAARSWRSRRPRSRRRRRRSDRRTRRMGIPEYESQALRRTHQGGRCPTFRSLRHVRRNHAAKDLLKHTGAQDIRPRRSQRGLPGDQQDCGAPIELFRGRRGGSACPVRRSGQYQITTFLRRTQMKPSTKDELEGKLHETKGKVKEKVGQVINIRTWRRKSGRKGSRQGPKESRPG